MFNRTKKIANDLINNRHNLTQKAIHDTIIVTRKANKHIRKEANTLKNDTKKTWKDAMSEAI